jgi:hypothetical protein
MAQIKRRDVTITSGGFQIYQGPGVLLGAVYDHNASSSSNVVTLYDSDNNNSTAVQLYTRSSDTDAGTTVPVRHFGNADLVAGTSTDNVGLGLPFSQGLYLTKTGDTTHSDSYKFFIKPLIRKTVNVTTAGSAGSGAGGATVFGGPGLLRAWRIKVDTLTPSTADITIKDSPIVNSGNTLMTKTNYGYAAEATRAVVTTTNVDEGGSTVTTAATGSYDNDGILFTTGLNVNILQANAQDAAYQFDFLIES